MYLHSFYSDAFAGVRWQAPLNLKQQQRASECRCTGCCNTKTVAVQTPQQRRRERPPNRAVRENALVFHSLAPESEGVDLVSMASYGDDRLSHPVNNRGSNIFGNQGPSPDMFSATTHRRDRRVCVDERFGTRGSCHILYAVCKGWREASGNETRQYLLPRR